MNELEIVNREPQALAVSGPEDPIGLFRLALTEKATPEALERVYQLYQTMEKDKAKKAFDRAMADFQSECPIIVKRKAGAKNAYRYAPLDDIVAQTRDLIRKHGFSFRITAECGKDIKAIVTITHCAGHSITSEFAVPVDSKNPMMSDPQRVGGAITFAKRYAFCNGFGILTADEDIDAGNKPRSAGPGRPVGTPQAQPQVNQPDGAVKALKGKLWALCKQLVPNAVTPADVENALIAQGVLDQNKRLAELSTDQMMDAADKIEVILSERVP